MFFWCSCSDKKYMCDIVVVPRDLKNENLVILGSVVELLDSRSVKIIHERIFEENIVAGCLCKEYVIICLRHSVYVLKQLNFEEVKKIDLSEDILTCSSEEAKSYFYIGCKNGLLIVYSIRDLESKVLVYDIWKFYCYKPIYNIAVQTENYKGGVKRNIFARFSPWINQAMEEISIYNILLPTNRTIILNFNPRTNTIIVILMITG